MQTSNSPIIAALMLAECNQRAKPSELEAVVRSDRYADEATVPLNNRQSIPPSDLHGEALRKITVLVPLCNCSSTALLDQPFGRC